MIRKHVNFVNQIYLKSASGRHVLHIVEKFAGFLNAGTRGSIDFNQINTSSFGNLQTGTASTTGCCGHAGVTIQALGKNPGDCRFTHSPGAGEQIGMMQSIGLKGINQRS